MFHYRDAKAGRFYLNRDDDLPQSPSETPPFLRFARKYGVGVDLWAGERAPAAPLLAVAGLHWSVEQRDALVRIGHGERQPTKTRGYQALVRPDTEQVMSIVTTGYSVAENRWVACALEQFSARLAGPEPFLAAVSFGRDAERTMFAARVAGNGDQATCLLAYNSHGGEGAVRFQLVEVDRHTGTTYVLGSDHAAYTVAHVGDVQERLLRASNPRSDETFIERYLAETGPVWERLEDTLWTRRHTPALIHTLWGDTQDPTVGVPGGPQGVDDVKARHPGHYLPGRMENITDAASAYRAICDWIDNHSEACERGDFTKDRDERLALGAGNKHKQRAWRWIVDNT